MTTLQLSSEGETVTLGGGTQLAVVEDGQCYLIDLSHTEGLGTPVVFHKLDTDTEESSGDGNDTIAFQYLSHSMTDAVDADTSEDGQPLYFEVDDEHARAVRNLLEFHNQQTNFSTLTEYATENEAEVCEVVAEADTLSVAVEGACPEPKTEPVQIVLPRNCHVPTSIASFPRPNQPLRTYGKRPMYKNETKSNTQPAVCLLVDNAKKLDNCQRDQSQTRSSIVTANVSVPKMKRRVIMDSQKVIPPLEFKRQLEDSSDITLNSMEYAPPTKKAMHYLTYGGVGKFFSNPGRKISSGRIAKLFFSHLSMTSEAKLQISASKKAIDPLDADLRTPVVLGNDLVGIRSRSAIVPSQFNDTVAKRAANAFDSFCKGMTRPAAKFEYSSKRSKSRKSDVSKLSSRLVNGRCPEQEAKQLLYVNNLSHTEEVVDVSDCAEEPSPTEDVEDVVFTIDGNNVIIKSDAQFTESYDYESCIAESTEQESANGPSKFDMLLAAAEQHNNNAPLPDASSDDTDTEKTEFYDKHLGTEPVYCNNDGVQEQLIVLDGNGGRFRVRTSTQGELTLTLWPDTEGDTTVFA